MAELKKEETEIYFDILNIYIKYFNTYYSKNDNLFSDIDNNDITSTNIQLEKLYEHIHICKNATELEKKIMNPSDVNINDIDELYTLVIDGSILKVCRILFPILEYIATNINWSKDNWKILHYISS